MLASDWNDYELIFKIKDMILYIVAFVEILSTSNLILFLVMLM